MQPHALNLSELRVETFATEPYPRDAATPLEAMHTRWPKDCPETLPQFC